MYWSVSYLNQARHINFTLRRKEFSVYGFFNIIVFCLVIGFVLSGIKYLLFLIPQTHVLAVYLFIATFIILLPLGDVLYLRMGMHQKKMLTYFKNIPLQDVETFYLYRKFNLFVFWTFFLFFPLSVETMPFSLFTLSLLGLYIMIISLGQRLFKDEQQRKWLSNILRICFVFLAWVLPQAQTQGFASSFFLQEQAQFFSSYITKIIEVTPLYYFLILILLFFTITRINIKRIYEQQAVQIEGRVRYTYFKDLHILYILRTDMLAGLLTIIVMSFIGFDQPLLNAQGFTLTILTSYLMIYYSLLQNDRYKIPLFYQASRLAKIRWDKVLPIVKFSVVYLLLALILGIYTGNLFAYILSYVIATVSLVLTIFSVKISIEKRKQNKIVSWQDIIKIMLVSMIFVFGFNYLISYF